MSASELLTGAPQEFARASTEDLDRARGAVARLKAMPPSLASLAAWDEATCAISDASARASLLRSVHPEAAMRDLGEKCEQESEALATGLALDPDVYRPLSQIDASREDEGTRWYLFRVLRDFRRAGVDCIIFPVDFRRDRARPLTPLDFLPSADALAETETALRECYGNLFYRLVR